VRVGARSIGVRRSPARAGLAERAADRQDARAARLPAGARARGGSRVLPLLLAVTVLADIGLATIGALLASIAVNTRARDLLLPILLLPLALPVVIAAAEATKALLSVPLDSSDTGQWLAVLALYDGVFALLGYAVFDFLMED